MEESRPQNDRTVKLQRWFSLLWLMAGLAVVVWLFLELVVPGQRVGSLGRPPAQNSLKSLVLGLHNYADQHAGRLPPASLYSKDGRPLLSWRVIILPLLNENSLFAKFKLDEPWDSPHNIQLLGERPNVYAPDDNTRSVLGPYHTFFQVFVGKGTAFEGTEGLDFRAEFPDGYSRTILIVEGGPPVPWTKPEDIPYAADQPIPKFASVRDWGFYVAMADGSTRHVEKKVSAATLRAAITRNGDDELGPDWNDP